MNEIHRHQLSDPGDYLRFAVGTELTRRREIASNQRLRRRLARDRT